MNSPTKQQQAIFDEVPTLNKDCAVIARAGTGKTYTATKTAELTKGKVVLLAFDKEAATELSERYRGNKKNCRTFHSWGFASIKDRSPWCVFDKDNRKVARFLEAEAPELEYHHWMIRRAVSFEKQNLRSSRGVLQYELAQDIEDDDELEEVLSECLSVIRDVLDYSLENCDLVDFDDMLYIPAKHNAIKPNGCDVLFIDESQDVNKCQSVFAGRMKCRKVWIGDPYQAIYGWRGASAEFLTAVASQSSYPLTYTFRCGKEIVKLCRRLVPDFDTLDNHHQGTVQVVESLHDAQPGDFILARTNAALVPLALDLASEGKKCVIVGKGFGGASKKLLKKIGADNIKDLRKGLADYIEETRNRDITDESKGHLIEIAQIVDYAAGSCQVIGQIPDLLKLMFSAKADDTVIRLSTVHKSKGKEANNVFVLEGSLSERSEEERNIKYVAYSRARYTLNRYYPPIDS